MTRWMFRSAARMANYRSYRDTLSRDAMRDLGVDVSHDEVFPDLALALETPPPRREPDLVGVGMMNFRGRSEDRAHAASIHEQYATAMEEAVRRLIAGGWRVLLLVGDVEDIPVVERVHAGVATDAPPGSVEVATIHTFEELLEGIARTYLFMGTRYHNVLASLSLGTPTISISYASKNDVLMESFDLGDFCQWARAVNVDRLCEQVAALVHNHAKVRTTLETHRPAVRAEVAQQLRSVSDDLLAIGLVRQGGGA